MIMLEHFGLDSEVDMLMNDEADEIAAAAEDMVMSNSTDIDIIGGITDDDIPEYDPTEDEDGIDEDDDVIEYHYETEDYEDEDIMDDIEDAIDTVEDDDEEDEEDEEW